MDSDGLIKCLLNVYFLGWFSKDKPFLWLKMAPQESSLKASVKNSSNHCQFFYNCGRFCQMSPNDEWKGESGEDSVFYSGSFSCRRTCGLCQIYTTIWFLSIGLCYEICYSLQLYCQFILIDKCGKYLITRSWKMN